jgi:hypothetical protein
MDYYNIGTLCKNLEKEVKDIDSRLRSVEANTKLVNDNLRVIHRLAVTIDAEVSRKK